jgi:Tfp pilus assembly protein PilF
VSKSLIAVILVGLLSTTVLCDAAEQPTVQASHSRSAAEANDSLVVVPAVGLWDTVPRGNPLRPSSPAPDQVKQVAHVRLVSQPKRVDGQRLSKPSESENPFVAAGNSISNGWKKMSSDIGDALTIHPKVDPPNDDPTRLSTPPGELGPHLYVSAAALAASRGDFTDAERQLHKALEVEPNNLEALLVLSRLKHRQNKLDEAERWLRQAVAAHPKNAVAANDYGLCLARKGSLPPAIGELRRAIQLDGKNARYRNNIAAVLVDAGRPDEALSHLHQVHPRGVAHYNLGYLLSRAGHADAARAQLQLALQVDPQLTAARDMLARLPQSRERMNVASQSAAPQHQTQPPAPVQQQPRYSSQYPGDRQPQAQPRSSNDFSWIKEAPPRRPQRETWNPGTTSNGASLGDMPALNSPQNAQPRDNGAGSQNGGFQSPRYYQTPYDRAPQPQPRTPSHYTPGTTTEHSGSVNQPAAFTPDTARPVPLVRPAINETPGPVVMSISDDS